MGKPLIIVGANAGPAARSAARAGFDPWCFDLYARRDVQDIARTQRCPAADFPAGLMKLIEATPVPDDADVLLTGGMENYADLLEALAFDRDFIGSNLAAIRAARDPKAFADLPKHKGLKFGKVRYKAAMGTRAGRVLRVMFGGKGYLIKPRGSFRGVDIQHWSAVGKVSANHYLQQYVKGTPVGIVFRGDGWSCHLVGVTEMMVGDPAFGSRGFLYAGNVGPLHLSDRLRKALMHLGVVLTQRHDLRGVFGVDGIMDFGGNIWPIEINPRYTDSIEVLEIAGRKSILAAGTAVDEPQGKKARRRTSAKPIAAKAILRAKQDSIVPDLYNLLEPQHVTDVPAPGRGIRKDGFICTVHSTGATDDECLALLRNRAEQVFVALKAGKDVSGKK